MIDGHFWDKLEAIARGVMAAGPTKKMQDRADRPFGGIQLILCGDFFQLPPVGVSNNAASFLFEAKSWSRVLDDTVCIY